MMRSARILLGVTLLVLALGHAVAPPARAAHTASPASLVADRVQVLPDGRIIAEGNVIVIYEDFRLTATRIVYDRAADMLNIEGPLTLTQGPDRVVLASAAELSTDLRNGILQSARLVLDQQLQIAAAEINRVAGRYTQMHKVVASSCQVCGKRPVPLWQIRASRVVHDQQERQLYFHDAQLRFMDVPIFYLPRLRLPDPSLKRATGFLTPKIRSNSILGTGIRVPYFIVIGDHADLTLAPYLSSKTRTLETRYRHEFRSGRIELNGAVSQDQNQPGPTRFYFFGLGDFDLGRDFKLHLQTQQVSDVAYLAEYGYSDQDRLESGISLTRTRRNEDIRAAFIRFETLRADELAIQDELPALQGDVAIERRIFPGLIGGELRLGASAQGHARLSADDMVGRDVARIGASALWQRDWVIGPGVLAELRGFAAADAYVIGQDSNFPNIAMRVTPGAAVTLRWPLRRVSPRGAIDILEPVAQLAWTGANGGPVPNEDSLLVEFDEANLFDLSRFPGHDGAEIGARANLGLSWTHIAPEGWSWTLAGGKVLRATDGSGFSAASGLSGFSSNWLIAGQARLRDRFWLQSRVLMANNFRLTKAETRAHWNSDALSLSSGHIWIVADADEKRLAPTHEWTADLAWQFTPTWRAAFDWRFNIAEKKATRAGLGLQYRNECLTVDLSLSRRFTASATLQPGTDVGLSVTLTGFGGATGRPGKGCQG